MSSFIVLFFALQFLPAFGNADISQNFLGTSLKAGACSKIHDSCIEETKENGKINSCFRSVTPNASAQYFPATRAAQRIDPTVYTVAVTSGALKAPDGHKWHGAEEHATDDEHTRVAKLLRIPSEYFPDGDGHTTCVDQEQTTCKTTPLVDEFVSLTSTGGQYDPKPYEHWMTEWEPTGFRAGEHEKMHLLLGDHIGTVQQVLGIAGEKDGDLVDLITPFMVLDFMDKAGLPSDTNQIPKIPSWISTSTDLRAKLLEKIAETNKHTAARELFQNFLQRLTNFLHHDKPSLKNTGGPVLKIFLYTCRARSGLAETGSLLDAKFDMPEGTFHVLPIDGSVSWKELKEVSPINESVTETGKFYVKHEKGEDIIRDVDIEKEYLESALQLKPVPLSDSNVAPLTTDPKFYNLNDDHDDDDHDKDGDDKDGDDKDGDDEDGGDQDGDDGDDKDGGDQDGEPEPADE